MHNFIIDESANESIEQSNINSIIELLLTLGSSEIERKPEFGDN